MPMPYKEFLQLKSYVGLLEVDLEYLYSLKFDIFYEYNRGRL